MNFSDKKIYDKFINKFNSSIIIDKFINKKIYHQIIINKLIVNLLTDLM